MRIAALSDIHGNLPALEAVLADARRRGCERIVNLGDILSGPLWPAETADRLMPLGLPTIRGNHERQLLEQPPERMGASDRHAHACLDAGQRAWLEALPATLWLDDEVFLCHGTPGDDLEYFLEDVDESGTRIAPVERVRRRLGDIRARVVLCGHTHTQRMLRLDDGRLVVNPGSVGLQAFEWDRPFPHTMQMHTPHARYAVLERSAGDWSVDLVSLAYDWELAARQAERNGRAEWAHALRTGRMA
ncbi:metallophosphoesterase family protein [Pseudoxanthomonas helianthi]|uniref:Metallophosphoesterase family protein n=1 Tax=Pseudoxanthomonas helianthi TaxID=1453541 RepID=A0A941AVG3_9GAMM|nr:metallophosphoesterase family protein [Pseudoxanthomonas helianthi]MBP3985636.1 metallophosphoesterase family protein [Pseudoxanthomonas helianthi]